MRFLFTAMIFIGVFSHAYAGGEVGNGGNVIVCADSTGKIKSVELLDYYELHLSGGQLSLNPDLQTYQEKLFDLFKKWKDVAPKRMAQYTEWLTKFTTEAGIYSNIEIPHIPDTGSIAIPKGCKTISIAFQRPDSDIFPGTKRYIINKDLWDHMDETQKAGLVLHELIYREAIQAAHITSLPTRYFNGYLSSAEPDGEEYAHIVAQLPLLWVEYGQGIVLKIGHMFKNSFIRTTEISQWGKVVQGEILEVTGNFKLNGWEIKFSSTGRPQSQEYSFQLNLNQMDETLEFETHWLKAPHIKSISLQDKFHIDYLKIGTDGVRVNLREGVLQTNRELNPENTWVLNGDGKIITGIVFSSSNQIITTIDGNRWFWDDVKKIYVLEQFFFQVGKDKVECKKNKAIFECGQFPKQLTCKVAVRGSDESKEEVLMIKEPVLTLENDSRSNIIHSLYFISLPKGQIVAYQKGRRKLQPIKLEEDRWGKVMWKEDGSCELK